MHFRFVVFASLLFLAACSGGGGKSHSKEGATIPPATGLSVTAGDGAVFVQWAPMAISSDGYRLYWSRSSNATTANANHIDLTQTQYLHQPLENGSTYYYFFTAMTPFGESPPSATVLITPQAPAPGAPVNLNGAGGFERITLLWDIPELANTDTAYKIYWNTTGNVTTADTSEQSQWPVFVHSGITNGRQYYYRISAVNDGSEGPLSSEISMSPYIPSLTAPHKIIANAEAGKVTLNWNTVEHAAGYRIFWNDTGNVGRTDKSVNVDGNSHVFDELVNGRKYFFVIYAVNGEYESPPSLQIEAIPAPLPPDTPGNFKAAAGIEQVTLTWDPAATATQYNVYWNTGSAVHVIPNASSPFTHRSLEAGKNYHYSVSSVTTSVEGPSTAQITAIPLFPPPKAPAALNLNATSNSITVSWQPVDQALYYNVYWNQSGDVSKSDELFPHVQSPFTHTGLTEGDTYYYRVASVGKQGEGDLSAEYSIDVQSSVNPNLQPVITEGNAITVPLTEATPFNLTLNAIDPDQNTLTWSILTVATHGDASVSGTGNQKSIDYVLTDTGYFGTDSFVVQVDDGNDGTDTITVTVDVGLCANDPDCDFDQDGIINSQDLCPAGLATGTDTDGDGCKDSEDDDDDNDGLTDLEETQTYHTNPLLADHDGDGLNDGDEVRLYFTDPLSTDTDGDSQDDGVEISNNTNPAEQAGLSQPLLFYHEFTFGRKDTVVPAGCYQLTIKTWGGGGGQNWSSGSNPTLGGGGGYAQSTVNVVPGKPLEVYVGQGGEGGSSRNNTSFGGASGGYTCHFGGAGGGSSEVRIDGVRVTVAGGGGGSGNNRSVGHGGPGGGAVGGNGGTGYTTGTGGLGGDNTGAVPDGESQSCDQTYDAHSGAGGGGYSGGKRGTSYGAGGGGGSSFGDTTEAGIGRQPGNPAEAGLAGRGGIGWRYYTGGLHNFTFGGDGKVVMLCAGPPQAMVDQDTDLVLDQAEIDVFASATDNQDSDGDGLSDYAENAVYGTNPSLADSDGDGLTDMEEVTTYFSDPLKVDTDGDLLNDFLEVQNATNIHVRDSDNDTLSDYEEVVTYGSNPNLEDTDGDTLLDQQEIRQYETSPVLADSDGDTLRDDAELLTHRTDPNLADSDNDTLSDADEINIHGTDPRKQDSDDDWLTDADELNIYGTNPNLADSDSDGFTDGAELLSKPLIGADPPVDSISHTVFGQYIYTIPAGCNALQVKAWGGGGGQNWSSGGNDSMGGGGGYATMSMRVSEGDVFDVFVGQGGASGTSTNTIAFGGGTGGNTCHFGGGGGGSSEIRLGTERLLVAGGGGGSGNDNNGHGGPGGGYVGGDSVHVDGGFGGFGGNYAPDGQTQCNTFRSSHTGAGGGGLNGGRRGRDYGAGGGGGSSFGDSTIAGNGRLPGNIAEAGNSGFGGVSDSIYDGTGPQGYSGSDGRIDIFCHNAPGFSNVSDPNDIGSTP